MFAAREPSRRGSCDFLRTGSRIARPCNEPIRAHEQRAQSEAILGVASHVPDMVAPKAVERLEQRLPAEVQKQAVSISEQHAEPRSVLQLEVRAAATHERVLVAEVVAEGYTPDTFGEVGRAVACIDQVADDGCERVGTSTGRPKFVRGSLDRSDDPREGGYQQLKEGCKLVPEAGALPTAGVRSALEGPEVNRGAPEPSVQDGVVFVAGHEREEIGTAADA